MSNSSVNNKLVKNSKTGSQPVVPQSDGSDWKILWPNVMFHIVWHSLAIYAVFLIITLRVNIKTVVWAWMVGWLALHGAISGGHRLWSHNAYKAKWPLKILLAFFQTIAGVHHIYDWALDHRIHHKFVDTYSDPYTSKRGLFYSHLGWLLITKHKSYEDKVKTMEMQDLKNDSIVMFQKKFYFPMLLVFGFIVPTIVPYYYWNENLVSALLVCGVLRQTLDMHMIFFVNSLAHYLGARPYDKNINPAENIVVSLLCVGEGYHNYHHTFPWDYKAAELDHWITNTATALIDLMAKIGWAYDLKTVSQEMILKRSARTGDGSKTMKNGKVDFDDLKNNDKQSIQQIWGWNDKDMVDEQKTMARISFNKNG